MNFLRVSEALVVSVIQEIDYVDKRSFSNNV